MSNPSTNIAQFWNYGTERYECLKTASLDAFLDIAQNEYNEFIVTVQVGKSNSWVDTSTYISSNKKVAILKAFTHLYHIIGDNARKIVSCPDILRPFKIPVEYKHRRNDEESIKQTTNVQLELF